MKINEYGSEFYINHKLFKNETGNILKDSSNRKYLRSGRDSLGYIAENIMGNTKNILIPALSCESMVKPFTNKGINFKFYKIDSKFKPDKIDIYRLIENGDALLYIDYFGAKSLDSDDICLIRKQWKNIKIIEDRTHNIFNEKIYSKTHPDYIIASLRKWFALPDGGLAYSCDDDFNMKPMDSISLFTEIRKEALQIKYEYLKTGEKSLKVKYRLMLSNAEDYISKNEDILGMSEIARKIYMNFNIDEMKLKRKENFSYLLENLKNNDFIDCSLANLQDCPLYFPILIKEREEIQKKLALDSIYCPVIWPVPEEAKNICENSNYISKHILAVPCDHRYSINDMKYISNKLVDSINN